MDEKTGFGECQQQNKALYLFQQHNPTTPVVDHCALNLAHAYYNLFPTFYKHFIHISLTECYYAFQLQGFNIK